MFTRVTGRPAIHRVLPMDEYMAVAEPYPGAPVNWTAESNASRDASIMNTAWWLYWSGGLGATGDFVLLDDIHPSRIESLEEWMRKVDYQGKPHPVLKMMENVRSEKENLRGHWSYLSK